MTSSPINVKLETKLSICFLVQTDGKPSNSCNKLLIQVNLPFKLGKNIVCDRYWYSGVAYSYAKGLDFDWCIKPDEGLIEPDLIIYLKADP